LVDEQYTRCHDHVGNEFIGVTFISEYLEEVAELLICRFPILAIKISHDSTSVIQRFVVHTVPLFGRRQLLNVLGRELQAI
jgi:hypothetical protein